MLSSEISTEVALKIRDPVKKRGLRDWSLITGRDMFKMGKWITKLKSGTA